jgi:recombination protein RecA
MLAAVEKKFGPGAIMWLEDASRRLSIEAIPTGSLALDLALGIGGIPRGRVTEIFGGEGSGKSTLALHLVAETHRLHGLALYVDAEHALQREYVERCGVDGRRLLISQPETAEEALGIVEAVIPSGNLDLVVVDSVAALLPEAELADHADEPRIAEQARLMSQALRRLCGSVSRSRTCLVFLNQLRERIGTVTGSVEFTPGGRALKFYSTVRIQLRQKAPIKEHSVFTGTRVLARVLKNKVAAPFRSAEFDIIFGQGIDGAGEIVDTGYDLGVIKHSSGCYRYDGHELGADRAEARQFLRENADIRERIREQVRHIGLSRQADEAFIPHWQPLQFTAH